MVACYFRGQNFESKGSKQTREPLNEVNEAAKNTTNLDYHLTMLSAQMRLIFTGLAFTILISLYISQQSINCYQFMQMTDQGIYYDYADDDSEELESSSPMPRARAIRKEPYNCGVLLFYHIPSTGGSSSKFLFCSVVPASF